MKKKALLTSVLTIALCLSLIAGSTFALFTSESKVNVAVTSGKVNVVATIADLELYSPKEINSNYEIADSANMASEGNFYNGGTAELDGNILTLTNITPGDKVNFTIQIENNSNVAIQYRVVIKCEQDDGLYKGLVYSIDGVQTESEGVWTYVTAGAKIEDLACSVELPASAGNDYQDKSCKLAITVEAVQGNTSTNNKLVSNTEELVEALSKGNNVTLASGTYTIPAAAIKGMANEVTITGNGDAELNIAFVNGDGGSTNYAFDGKTVTLQNVTINTDSAYLNGFVRAKVNYNSCTINGTIYVFDDSSFNDCEFNVTGDNYAVWTGGKNVNFSNCTFNTEGKAILVYDIANKSTSTVNVDGCTFIDSKLGSAKKAAIETGNDYDNTYYLNLTNNTVVGFDINANSDKQNNIATNTRLYSNKNGMDAGHLIVTLKDNFECDKLISTAEQLVAFAEEVKKQNYYTGKLVALGADIDLSGVEFSGIGEDTMASYPGYTFNGTFDGQGHTISNMTVTAATGDTWASAGLFGTLGENAVVKNLNIDNALVSSTHYAGAIAGYSSYASSSIVNCTVTNSTIVSAAEEFNDTWDNGDKVGGIIGYTTGSVSDCSVSDTTIQGYRDLGGIKGYAGAGTLTNCTISNVTILIDNTHDYKNYGKEVEKYNLSDYSAYKLIVLASDASSLEKLLSDGSDVVLTDDVDTSNAALVISGNLDGNGNTITGYTGYDTALVVTSGTVSNLTVTGAGRGLGTGSSGKYSMTGDVTYNNVTVEGATYGVNIGNGGGYKLTMNNCTFGPWNSYAGLGSAEFNNCTFTANGKYKEAQTISANATFTYNNCEFQTKPGYNNVGYYLDSYGNGIIVLNNCTVDGVAVTAENAATLFEIDGVTVIVNGTQVN